MAKQQTIIELAKSAQNGDAMSKPLIFVLEVAAVGFFVTGMLQDPLGWTQMTIGVVLAVVAGIAFRRRVKKP